MYLAQNVMKVYLFRVLLRGDNAIATRGHLTNEHTAYKVLRLVQ